MNGSSITTFQVEVAGVFFSLPEAHSFLLAGGLALAAHGLSDRPTEDLDAFTSQKNDVQVAFEAFSLAAKNRGWNVEVKQSTDTFVRLMVTGSDSLLVDIALDSGPGFPTTMSVLGPTFAPEELAARKLLALFDRAMPRDFVDIFRLASKWDTDRLQNLAHTIDPGFDLDALSIAMRQLERYSDADVPIDGKEIPALREFFHTWVKSLHRGE